MSTPRIVQLSINRSMPFPRNLDADSLETKGEDTANFAPNASVLRVADLLGHSKKPPMPRKQCGSPRTAAFAAPLKPESDLLSNHEDPKSFAKRKYAESLRGITKSRLKLLPRSPSPVGEFPVDTVVPSATLASPPSQIMNIQSPRRALLSSSDGHKVTKWLQSLSHEAASFTSYALYCEMLFRESRVLTQGKPVPNRLQTAIAFHCLCKATGIFARHEGILIRICNDLGAAIYLNHDPLLIHNGDIDALDFFTRLTTYYEQQAVSCQQKQDLQQEMLRQQATNQQRLNDMQALSEELEHLHRQNQVNQVETINTKKTHTDDLNGKLQTVLQNFQHVKDHDKEKIVLGAIEALNAQVSATAVAAIADQMDPTEKDKLISNLCQDELKESTQKIESQVLVKSSAQQDVILEQSATRAARFQNLILDVVKILDEVEEPKDSHNFIDEGDDSLGDDDRKVLEVVGDVVDELKREKQKSKSLEQRLEEAEILVNDLRWKNNALANDVEERARQHKQQLFDMNKQIKDAQCANDDKAIQTDENLDELQRKSESRGKRRKHLVVAESDDGLIVKNRVKNKSGYGIANIIDQAKIAPSKVRKILLKRKPLTLNELHSIIVGYYQAKMVQDIQDDSSGKPRTDLAQFIMEMYVLHYGLKDLAISQLVFLDAAIRKNARESARVRTFGLLTGSLNPESHACSIQGIDFFLLVVVIIFNAGVYKNGRKQAISVAQNLKTFFGDGGCGSLKPVTVKHDILRQAIDLAFSFTRNEQGGPLSQLKDELCNKASAMGGELSIDNVLEMTMKYWFLLFEQQIQDIHTMFALVDTNGDGILDFQEFCGLVVVLEPTIDRRDALILYNRAAGEDNVIDKDEFVQVMLAHQRGVILDEFYGGKSNKKILMGIEQRRNTLLPSSFSKSTSQEKEEASFDSLNAAMASISMALEEDGTDKIINESDETETDLVQESVSFQTLSRLSTWATKVKLKLRSSDQNTVHSLDINHDTT